MTRFVVLTRFGLGQSADSFYQANLPLLQNFLAPSINGQLATGFVWLLLVDSKVPPWVRQALLEMQSEVGALRLVFHDPFSNWRLLPSVAEVLRDAGANDGDYVVTVRVDADDALATNYLASLRAAVDGLQDSKQFGPHVFLSESGAAYFTRARQNLSLRKANYSVLACGSFFGNGFEHCYGFPHSRVADGLAGFKVAWLQSEMPLWLRVVRPNSVTRSGPHLKVAELLDFVPVVRIWLTEIRKALGIQNSDHYAKPIPPDTFARLFSLNPRDIRGAVSESRRGRSASIPRDLVARYAATSPNKHSQLTLKVELLRILSEFTNAEFVKNGTPAGNSLERLKIDFYRF